jgi:hypothetical protein
VVICPRERYLLTRVVAPILGAVPMRALILCAALAASVCGGVSAASGSSTGSGAPPPRSGHVPCGPASARTLAASSSARVYASGGSVFGCSTRAAGSTQLGQVRSCIGRPQVGPAVVKGELAAFGLRRCGVDTGQASVVVERLDTRRTLHSASAFTGRLRPESYTQVTSLVLKPDGSVAWIGTAASVVNPNSQSVEVHALGRAGGRVLDSGAAIAVGSLRLHGSVLSWRHGSRTRNARLA